MFESRLPEHCDPTTTALYNYSSFFHACVPTPLALISTLLGTLSIVSWLFAQLPQIYKNFKIKSTAGLSIYFLVEWFGGDFSNLIGSILTRQATWQVVVSSYFCFVDIVILGQWIWYEHLKHGRRIRIFPRRKLLKNNDRDRPEGMNQVAEGYEPLLPNGDERSSEWKSVNWLGNTRSGNYGLNPPGYETFTSSPPSRSGTPININREAPRNHIDALPSPSPKTFLMISLVLALAVNASPLPQQPPATAHPPTPPETPWIGTALSWVSATLYLGSRLPQIIKNARRRSTAGLSPSLFGAAFLGNLFYSSSMLANPLAWDSYPSWGHHGWVREFPSVRSEWVTAAAPFWLGAAGVLLLDATVGVQFWIYGDEGEKEIIVVVEAEDDDASESSGRGKKYNEVSGWMRGWKPSASSIARFLTPPGSPALFARGQRTLSRNT